MQRELLEPIFLLSLTFYQHKLLFHIERDYLLEETKNSTNLVNPQPAVNPQLKTLPEKSFFKTLPLVMPKPLAIEKNQRPFPI